MRISTLFTHQEATGNPKGVQITYNCLVSFTKWAVEDFNLQTGQVFLNQAPFSFDLSVMDIYPSLVTGGTLWAIDKDMIARPKRLVCFFRAIGYSSMDFHTFFR